MEDSVVEGVQGGNGLVEAALTLAVALDDPSTSASARAALARELRMLIAAIAEQAENTGGDQLDELARRRKERLSR